MRFALLFFCALLYPGCSPSDVEPPETASFYYRNDGTRRIAPTSPPKITSTITDQALLAENVIFSTTPLPLPESRGIAIGTNKGEVLIFGSNDSLARRVALPEASPLFRLAANNTTIIALQNSGIVTAIGYDGKIRWQTKETLRLPDINLAGNDLLVIAFEGIQCYNVTSGVAKYRIVTPLMPVSVASNGTSFYVAVSWQTTTGSDSIYAIGMNGNIEKRWGFHGLRITSNIALSDDEHNTVVFGAQGEFDANGVRRRAFVMAYSLDDEAKQLLRQELDYIPTNISVVNDIALASGFQMAGQEYSGALDAFLISTNEKMWQRRFTEPLATPVAVTTQHAFFPLSFATKADIPSSGILYALDLATGESAHEVAVTDARNGFVPGLPVPYKGGLLLADPLKSTIYRLIAE